MKIMYIIASTALLLFVFEMCFVTKMDNSIKYYFVIIPYAIWCALTCVLVHLDSKKQINDLNNEKFL